MVKLLKNEWKRYRTFALIVLAVTVGLGLLLVLSVVILPKYEDSNFLATAAGVGNVAMIAMLMFAAPYAGYVYCIISYATDISRKGMIFLTPSPTWKIILSKLIFGSSLFVVLYIVTQGEIYLAGLIANISENEDMIDTMDLFTVFGGSIVEYDSEAVAMIMRFLNGFMTSLHSSILIMACISLARFAVNPVGAQVVLTIVFTWLVGIIESLLNVLISLFFKTDDDMFLYMLASSVNGITGLCLLSVIYSAVLYIICVCLTDKKVNLV